MSKLTLTISLFLLIGMQAAVQGQDAKEILRKALEQVNGLSSHGEIKMTIVRPDWSREISIKSWSKDDDLALMLITAPARDEGTGFLKRDKEIWNWQPSISRVIKMPPSMMTQSWMGSDFTNDDLVKQSSIVDDYTHRIIGTETLEGRECTIIELIPKPDAPVVWGKVVTWVDNEDYLQLKTEFYDEDDFLVNTMLGTDITEMGGRMLAKRVQVIPADEPGNKTIVEQLWIEFDIDLDDSFFTVQNMKRVR